MVNKNMQRPKQKWYIGIDEAGRGSLVGEMIVAVAAIPETTYTLLREEGVKDSKQLTPRARGELYRKLINQTIFSVQPVKPEDIDNENLNRLTAKAAAEALSRVINRIGEEENIVRVVIDKFGDPSYPRILIRKLGYRGPLIIVEKADRDFPEVSAASIIAKYVRDARIRVLHSIYGVEGSGYPSDPRTMAWLKTIINRGIEPPPIIRRSWGTLKGTRWYKEKKSGPSRITLEDFF